MLRRYQPLYESTLKKMIIECQKRKTCSCMEKQENDIIEIEEADAEYCNLKTQKKANQPGKPKFKFSGGTCEVTSCSPGYIPNKDKTDCILMPKKH